MSFNLVRVSRSAAAGGNKRTTPDVSAALNKHGDLTIVLSPAFFTDQTQLAVGARILIGYNSETCQLALIPAAETDTESVRTIRKRPSLEGAGTVFIKAGDLPDGLNVPVAKRTPVEWAVNDDGVLCLTMEF